jgi:erythromycin esterase-like protein
MPRKTNPSRITRPSGNTVARYAVPIASLEPPLTGDEGKGFQAIVGTARLVGMGEATHGSREYSLLRLTCFQYLVMEMNYIGLILETPSQQAAQVDAYIKGAAGDPYELLHQLGYWLHDTPEMLAVISWMRDYNRNNPTSKLSFIGCDIPLDDDRRSAEYNIREKAMADHCLDALNHIGPSAKLVLWSHNLHTSYVIDGITSQGQYLHEQVGEDYVAIVALSNKGQFTAVGWNDETNTPTGFQVFDMPKASDGTYEYLFASVGYPIALFDMKALRRNEGLQGSQLAANTVRDVGSVFDPAYPERMLRTSMLTKTSDAVMWIDTITASKPFHSND